MRWIRKVIPADLNAVCREFTGLKEKMKLRNNITKSMVEASYGVALWNYLANLIGR